jgi:hypothetical protein
MRRNKVETGSAGPSVKLARVALAGRAIRFPVNGGKKSQGPNRRQKETDMTEWPGTLIANLRMAEMAAPVFAKEWCIQAAEEIERLVKLNKQLLHEAKELREYVHVASGKELKTYLAKKAEDAWHCQARQSNTAANDPAECDWPLCGCDPYADKVIYALRESGWLTA